MKKYMALVGLLLGVATGCFNKVISKPQSELMEDRPNIYRFKTTDIQGNEFDFSTLKGKKIMLVNTASKCGLTPQYEQLQNIYEKYQGFDFVIIGFPANDFMSQEPGSNEEIAAFCELNYGVTFPMMSKISVKGEHIHPLYHFLTQKSENGFSDSEVTWNFQKYLLNRQGQLEMVIGPKVLPDSPEIIAWIEAE